MKKYGKIFILCGIIGWCLEIVFTALHNLQKHNFTLKGSTSLLMFPIYGMAVLFCPLHRLLQHTSFYFRGFLYACGILSMEYLSGSFLMKHHCCPWNYERSHWHIHSIIRLDYFPYWFLVGLLYERIFSHLEDDKSSFHKKPDKDVT